MNLWRSLLPLASIAIPCFHPAYAIDKPAPARTPTAAHMETPIVAELWAEVQAWRALADAIEAAAAAAEEKPALPYPQFVRLQWRYIERTPRHDDVYFQRIDPVSEAEWLEAEKQWPKEWNPDSDPNKKPPALAEPIFIEAEAFVLAHDTTGPDTNGPDVITSAAASGGKAVGYSAPGEWLEYTFDAPAAGDYRLHIVYANPAAGAQIKVSLNGGPGTAVVLPPTGSWSTFAAAEVPITAEAGMNRIRITNTAGANGWTGDFDRLEISTP